MLKTNVLNDKLYVYNINSTVLRKLINNRRVMSL